MKLNNTSHSVLSSLEELPEAIAMVSLGLNTPNGSKEVIYELLENQQTSGIGQGISSWTPSWSRISQFRYFRKWSPAHVFALQVQDPSWHLLESDSRP
mmetsp:Transcript_35372/g.54316  ORF Transcript_35372/g.54316 Transcript_35372/m.54316 type:complete len:98 (-) Transcript_35372:685-978(-)